MAQKRMFDKTITNSDDFLELPDSSQVLYFHLSMNADDDGFVNNWKSILKMTGTKEDDLKILIAKSFIIPFESGVIVIRHWRINNFLRKDRHVNTKFQQELAMLGINDSQEYVWLTEGQPSIDKNSIDKYSIEEKEIYKEKETKFKKPTLEEVEAYCKERNNQVNAERFIDFYESKGWKIGKEPMKDWKACIRTWEKSNKKAPTPSWVGKTYEQEVATKEEQEEIEKILNKFRGE